VNEIDADAKKTSWRVRKRQAAFYQPYGCWAKELSLIEKLAPTSTNKKKQFLKFGISIKETKRSFWKRIINYNVNRSLRAAENSQTELAQWITEYIENTT
jgi:hypothetical protein